MVDLILDEFSTELIIKICSYLKIEDLCRLKQTCKRFNEIISSWDNILFKGISSAVVTNQIKDLFVLKCFRRLTNLEKLRISNNWVKGKYFEKSHLGSKKKLIPYLQLTNKNLWISHAEDIICYERFNSCLNFRKAHSIIRGKRKVDIVNFQIKNGYLVCGLRDGCVSLSDLSSQNARFKFQRCHNSDTNSVDVSQYGSTIISGARDNDLKVWDVIQKKNTDDFLVEKCCVYLPDLIWKVSLCEDNQNCLAVGTAGSQHNSSLFIYDLNRMELPQELLINNSTFKGIFDIKWDGINTLWSCGYDSYLRRWDLRTGRCAQEFLDSCGSSLYCLDYDYHNTILTGASLHGRVSLWDIRKGFALQMYYMDSCRSQRYNRSSPIYSLAFNTDYLFTATDQSLNVLDFSVYNAAPKDYSFYLTGNIFRY